jgi:hypothetical protein
MTYYDRITCPRCAREVCIKEGRYAIHSISERTGIRCRMTGQKIPATGTDPDSFEQRAAIVADLAWQVQDGDPLLAWDYLTTLPAWELQRLMAVALAGIRIDQTVGSIFAWVTALPAAHRLQETA